MMVLEVTHEKG